MKTIEYKVSYEKMISRLPGLFAYLESDEFGNMVLHKATDSMDGCWGKIVENIKLPDGINLKEILYEGETYSFRTIIDYYYQYREELGEDDGFVVFIEKAIGKEVVPDDVKGSATPKYVYLSNVKSLYNQLVKMDKQCEFYNRNLKAGLTDKDKHLCCLCERYDNLGGDVFKEYVGRLIPKAEQIANEYFNYAKEAETEEKGMTLDFFADLSSTYQDYGIMSVYAPQWIPCKRYYDGDKVMFNDELYICVKENTGVFDEKLLTVVFAEINENNERIFAKYSDFNSFKDILNDEAKTEYNKSRIVAFNSDGSRPDDINQDNLPFMIESTTNSKLPDLHRFVTYYNDDGVAERPSEGYDWLFYYRVGTILNIRTINDDLGNILSHSLPQDENGNKKAATRETDLMAYGDVIENITYDTENHKIKFTYRIGVHLNANEPPIIVTDDDGNKLYNWKKFVWDENDKIGIKYEEEYNYEEEGDLDKLIKGEFAIQMEDGIQSFSFNEYINGKYDKMLTTYKFEFITINNSFSYDKAIAHQNVNIVSTLTDLQVYRKDFDEFFNSPLIREEYLNGITYKPTKDIDVRIERGSTSAFDKHIAFGEVKTLNDMIDYKNGSFFILTEG